MKFRDSHLLRGQFSPLMRLDDPLELLLSTFTSGFRSKTGEKKLRAERNEMKAGTYDRYKVESKRCISCCEPLFKNGRYPLSPGPEHLQSDRAINYLYRASVPASAVLVDRALSLPINLERNSGGASSNVPTKSANLPRDNGPAWFDRVPPALHQLPVPRTLSRFLFLSPSQTSLCQTLAVTLLRERACLCVCVYIYINF